MMAHIRCQSSDSWLLPDTVEDSEAHRTPPEQIIYKSVDGGGWGPVREPYMLEFSVVGNGFQGLGECLERKSSFPS